jgi:zinc D-Ala-D-Ala carboxypeptidase
MSSFYKHHSDVNPLHWTWPSFSPREVACKGTGQLKVHPASMDKLQALRDIIGVPFSPNSAYRSEKHNKAIGGSPKSQHLEGRAFDIPIKGAMTRERIHEVARAVGFTGIGDYNTFVHVDTGAARYWDLRK